MRVFAVDVNVHVDEVSAKPGVRSIHPKDGIAVVARFADSAAAPATERTTDRMQNRLRQSSPIGRQVAAFDIRCSPDYAPS